MRWIHWVVVGLWVASLASLLDVSKPPTGMMLLGAVTLTTFVLVFLVAGVLKNKQVYVDFAGLLTIVLLLMMNPPTQGFANQIKLAVALAVQVAGWAFLGLWSRSRGSHAAIRHGGWGILRTGIIAAILLVLLLQIPVQTGNWISTRWGQSLDSESVAMQVLVAAACLVSSIAVVLLRSSGLRRENQEGQAP